jgi:hypothetical protein
VVEHVLPVARAVLEATEQLDELWVQPRHTGVVGCLLARLAHDDLDLGAALGDRLLDASGVDAAVADELVERHPGNFAPHRVEAGEHDCFRRIVDDEVDAGGLLQGPDVPALAADDAALHLLVRQGDDGDRRLRGMVGGDALHHRRENAPGPVLALLVRVTLDVADPVLRLGLRLVNDLPDQALARLQRGEA